MRNTSPNGFLIWRLRINFSNFSGEKKREDSEEECESCRCHMMNRPSRPKDMTRAPFHILALDYVHGDSECA